MPFEPQNPWMTCQRTGKKVRKSEMKQEWSGLWVWEKVWEPRHPQDFVRAVKDDPSVPVAMPAIRQAVGQTTLNGAVAKDSYTAILTSISGVSTLVPIGIAMDNSITHWTYVNGTPSGNTITLGSPMPFAAASGNTVYVPSLNNENWQ